MKRGKRINSDFSSILKGAGSGIDSEFLQGHTYQDIVDYVDNNSGMDVVQVSSNYTALNKNLVVCDTSVASGYTITLPASPSDKDTIEIMDGNFNAGNINVTIDGNGNNILGSTSLVMDISGFSIILVFESSNSEWSASGTGVMFNTGLSDVTGTTNLIALGGL